MNQPFTNQPMLEVMFAIALPALGSAILFNIGSSSGGTDIIAMILKKSLQVLTSDVHWFAQTLRSPLQVSLSST